MSSTTQILRACAPRSMLLVLIVLCGALTAACGTSSSPAAPDLDPDGVAVAKAVRAAFPDYDPNHPTAVTEFAGIAGDTQTLEASEEAKRTLGITQWKITQAEDPPNQASDETYEAFVGEVRVLAVRFHSTGFADENEDNFNVRATFALGAHTASEDIVVKGEQRSTLTDPLAQTLLPLLSFEIGLAGAEPAK